MSALTKVAMCAALLAFAVDHSSAVEAPAPATLRVGVWTLWHDKEIAVAPTTEGKAAMQACGSCSAKPLRQPMQIRVVGNQLALGNNREAGMMQFTGPITIAAHGEKLTLRNPLRIGAHNGELILAVTLPVESYVERVVASESGSADSAESLKALAVVVRSFALHQKHGHAEYDLCDSTHCQLLHWGGNSGRQAAAHAATLATAGETLWFHGQRAEAWFHQNCGGRTATPQEAWPGNGVSKKPMPWLTSHTDSYCTAAGAREWSTNLSLAELTSALAAQGLARPGWKNLVVAQRGESGRAVTLRVDGSKISAEDFRLAVGRALGWNKILSNWFEVTHQGEEFYFHGRGSGHGVGLCQVGAAVMAAQGRGYRQILEEYFHGATVDDEATGKAWQTLRGQGFVLETLDLGDAKYLPQLNQALAEAEARSGLQPNGLITVHNFISTPAFRDATLAPGWVAAFTEGNWIGTQPLRILAGRKLLATILRHEFLHALVESQTTARTPLWLREGVVEAWTDNSKFTESRPVLKLDQIDDALAHSTSETQSEAAHRAAGWYAERLLNRFGRAQVLGWLHSGVPASALNAIQ